MGINDLALLPIIGKTIIEGLEFIGKGAILYRNSREIGKGVYSLFKQNSLPSLPNSPVSGLLPGPPIAEIKSDIFLNVSTTNSFCPANYLKTMVSSVKNQTLVNNTIQNTTSLSTVNLDGMVSSLKNQTAETGSQMTQWIVDSISSAGRKLDETIGANIPFWDSVSTTSKVAAGCIFTFLLWRLTQGQKNIQNVTIHHHGPQRQGQTMTRQSRSNFFIEDSYLDEPSYRPRKLKKKEASAS